MKMKTIKKAVGAAPKSEKTEKSNNNESSITNESIWAIILLCLPMYM